VHCHTGDFLKDLLKPIKVAVSLREEVRISGGSMYLFGPEFKEERPFQNKGIFMGRLADAVQNTFESVLSQEKIEVFFLSSSTIQQALLYGRSNIRGDLFAQTRDSI
jgi:hypothetical protein